MRSPECLENACALRNFRLDAAVALAVALALACPSSASAQGSEPRLLVPPTTPEPSTAIPPPAPVPESVIVPQAAPSVAPPLQTTGSATARLELRMTQLEQDVRSVTGRLEDVSYQLRKLQDSLTKLSSDIDYRLSQSKTSTEDQQTDASKREAAGSGAAAVASRAPSQPSADEGAASKATPATGGASPSRTASVAPNSPRERYARAFSLLEKRNYEEAGAGFSEFLKDHPDDPLADNARYWLGESYYARGDYAHSAEAFLGAYEKNKTGPKAPDTLLKLGLSLAALDKNKEACASFREVRRAFPNAPGAVKDRAAEEGKRLGCS